MALASSCNEAAPTAPTSVPPPTRPTRPVDPRFRDRFWRELVFDQHDEPGTVERARSWVLDTTNPNVYIRMGDPNGRRVVSYDQRDHMRRAIPRLAEQTDR